MKLIPDWNEVLKKAWSMRLIAMTALFSALEVVLPMFTDSIPPRTMAVIALALACASAISRVLSQPELQK